MERTDKIRMMVREMGIVRPRDVEAEGIPREYLLRLYRKGELERIGRGLYVVPNTLTSEFLPLLEVAKRVPNAVICLLSALQFHDLTTQWPQEVWIAVETGNWRPAFNYPPISVFNFSGLPFNEGIEKHEIDNVTVRVYNIAKSISDCFRFRNQIGLDIALEALRDAWYQKRVSMDELWHYADVCSQQNVMRPYLESLT